MDPKKLMTQLEKVFAAAPAGPPPQPAGPEPRPLAADTVLVLERPWKGTAFVYGYPAPGYSDPDYPAFAIIDSYLRSEDRSQIIYWMQVRDDAVSPGIVFTLFPTRGSIAIFFGATPEKLPVARDTTLSVLRRLREEPLERGEYLVHVRRVQDGFFAKQHVPIVRARNMSRWASEGLPDDYPARFETAVLNLTPETVRAAAERWFTHSCEVVLGPPQPASGDGAH
jgi:predicted Zn-dependent peptidase